jgi:hypothetical protein
MRRLSHLTTAALMGAAFGLTSSALAQPPPTALAPACHSHADLAAMLNQRYF